MEKALAMWLMIATAPIVDSGPTPPGAAATPGGPTQVVQTAVEEVGLAAQRSDPGQGTPRERRRALIQQVAERFFDFGEMARRTLAQHWRDRTAQEREEFVGLFKEFMGRAYLDKLEGYSGARIVYTGESVDGQFATVRSRVVTGRGEVPVDYRLHLVGSRWAVFDVAVEGISLVSSYRGQFNKIIRTSSFDGLLRELRLKRSEAPVVRPAGAVPAASSAER